jgi:hypothetical protein
MKRWGLSSRSSAAGAPDNTYHPGRFRRLHPSDDHGHARWSIDAPSTSYEEPAEERAGEEGKGFAPRLDGSVDTYS